MLRVKFLPKKAPMLCVKFSSKMAGPYVRAKFYSKRPLLCVKFLPKKAPVIGVHFYTKRHLYFYAKFSHKKAHVKGPSKLSVKYSF